MTMNPPDAIGAAGKERSSWRETFVPKQKRQVRDLLDLGWKTYDESEGLGSRKDICGLVDKVLKMEPKNAEAFLLRAHALLGAEGPGPSAALRAMDSAYRLDRNVVRHGRVSRREMTQSAASMFFILEDYENALYTADGVLSEHPKDAAAFRLKLKCLSKMGRNQEALGFVDAMIKRSGRTAFGKGPEAAKQIGARLRRSWPSKKANTQGGEKPAKSLEYTPGNQNIERVALQHDRALILADMHDHKRAKEAFRTCLKHRDAGIHVFRSALNYFVEQGFHEDAWQAFARHSDYRDQLTADDYLSLVKSQKQLKRNPLSLLNTALGLHPRSAELHFEKADFLLEHDNARHAAMANLKDAVRYRGEYADAWYQIGKIHEQEGNFEKAGASFGKVLSIDPQDELSKESIKRILSRCKESDQVPNSYYEKEHAEGWRYMGSVYEKEGNPHQALRYFTYAARAEPEHEGTRLAVDRLTEQIGLVDGVKVAGRKAGPPSEIQHAQIKKTIGVK